MSIETGWHFSAKGGSSIGPVSLDRIRRAVNSGELQMESMVWHPSLGDWKLIRDVREVRPGSAVTPPPIVDQPVMREPRDEPRAPFNVNAEKLKDVKGWSFWPDNPAKRAMVAVSVSWIVCSLLWFWLCVFSVYGGSTYVREGNYWTNGYSYHTPSELFALSIATGFVGILAIAPFFIIALAVCFVAWFVIEPAKKNE